MNIISFPFWIFPLGNFPSGLHPQFSFDSVFTTILSFIISFRFWFGTCYAFLVLMNIISFRFWFGTQYAFSVLMNIISFRFWFGTRYAFLVLMNIISFPFWIFLLGNFPKWYTPLIQYWFRIHQPFINYFVFGFDSELTTLF